MQRHGLFLSDLRPHDMSAQLLMQAEAQRLEVCELQEQAEALVQGKRAADTEVAR